MGPGRATAVMFSCTLSERKMLRSCGTQPMPSAARVSGDAVPTSRPASAIEPAKRRVTPTRLSIKVVLPTPLRPRTASASPSSRRNATSDSTTARP